MAFWNSAPDHQSHLASRDGVRIDAAQQALTQSRRRLLGATILLLLACGLIPWMLDTTPRAWGDDVVLRMPQIDTPYQAKPDTKQGTKPDAKSSGKAPSVQGAATGPGANKPADTPLKEK